MTLLIIHLGKSLHNNHYQDLDSIAFANYFRNSRVSYLFVLCNKDLKSNIVYSIFLKFYFYSAFFFLFIYAYFLFLMF